MTDDTMRDPVEDLSRQVGIWLFMGAITTVLFTLLYVSIHGFDPHTNPETWTKSTEMCGLWCPLRDVIIPLAVVIFVVGLVLSWYGDD